ncbi:MAG: hypothetical protein BMS9Abin20_0358 [Acidimicrobiia bacterium]|nr:MAG: hypothetical protein BMS9Abin20_0358 [Acidimicrobiia bacterium]
MNPRGVSFNAPLHPSTDLGNLPYHLTMKAGDDGPRVRPISIEDDEIATPDGAPTARTTSDPPRRRRWIALVVSGSAIVLAIGAVSAFGALRFDDPARQDPAVFASGSGEDSTTKVPSALPQRLEEILPDLTDRLTLVALSQDGLETLLWDPSFRIPRPYDLPVATLGQTDGVNASFDSGGRTVAISVRSPVGTELYLGSPTNVGEQPDIVGASSFTWHATEVGAIAWVARDAGGIVQLHTATVSPLSGSLVDDVVVADLDGIAGVIRWDSAGFLINSVINDNMTVVSLGRDGSPLWSRQGVAVSASKSLAATIVPDDRGQDSRWIIIDRATGDPMDPNIDGSPEDVWVSTSRDTDLIAKVSNFVRRTSLTINGPGIAATRIIQVDIGVTPIGFSSRSEYFLFGTKDSNDIVFVNWRTGATHTVPVPDEYEVIGIDLG